MKIIGVILIVFGLVALLVGGFQYTTREKVLDLGPIEATQEKTRTVPLSPIVGLTSVVAGVVLVTVGTRTRV